MNRSQSRTVVAMGAAAVVLSLANVTLFASNTVDRAEIEQRERYVEQSRRLKATFEEMVRVTTALAEKTDDPLLHALLDGPGLPVNRPTQPATLIPNSSAK